jgi:hypothetical protein
LGGKAKASWSLGAAPANQFFASSASSAREIDHKLSSLRLVRYPGEETMEKYPPLYRFNRSEAPTSVALAMLLAEPSLGQSLLSALTTPLSWTMWRWTDDECSPERLTIPAASLEASALFFPFRDVGSPNPLHSKVPWRGEIDVVALMPGHAVIGVELKVLSTRRGLADQMNRQVAGLTMLADRYECPFLAQIALAADFPSKLHPRVNRLSFAQLRQTLDKLGAATAPARDVLAVVARQLDHVLGLTELPPDPVVSYVTLDELRRMGRDPTHASKWVGVIEGVEKLNLHSRPRWKIAKAKPGENWYPLPVVARRIEVLLPA